MDSRENEDCAKSDSKENTPKDVVSKRPRGSPTMHTPHREQKRVSLRESMAANNALEPRRLANVCAEDNVKEKWCDDEVKALIEFVLLHSSSEKWPSHKQAVFWNSAGQFVKERSGSSLSRSGMFLIISMNLGIFCFILASACRSKVVVWLMKQYKTPKEAEAVYFGHNLSSHNATTGNNNAATQCSSTQTDSPDATTILHLFKQVPLDSQLQVLSNLFSNFMLSKLSISVPDDYLVYSANAMAHLRHNARSNVLYNLAKGWGTLREDGSDSRFPVKRMPMGLIEYAASFFAFDNLQSVSMHAFLLREMIVLFHTGFMSSRLSLVATNHVLPFWPEMV